MPPPLLREQLLLQILQQELLNPRGDLFAVRLKSEVAGVQHMRFEILQIA
jgi:hypothetical protein